MSIGAGMTERALLQRRRGYGSRFRGSGSGHRGSAGEGAGYGVVFLGPAGAPHQCAAAPR
eukprot:3411895-Lingulodinium_polyedra.AAC.1